MFEILNCSAWKQDGSILFENISFVLNPKDRLAIIGEEGNGKSTLLKMICGLDTSPVKVVSKKLVRQNTIGYLSQHLDESWNSCTVLEYILKEKPNEEIEISRYNDCLEIEKLWADMKGSVSFLYGEQKLKTLSGGEKVRIQLLKLLYHKSTMLTLDEPTNDLDIETLQWLEEMILKFDGPVLFVSHDTALLRKCANRILHLELRNRKTKSVATLFEGSYDEYAKTRTAQLKKSEQIAASEKRQYRKKMDRLNDLYNAVHHAQNAVSRQDPFTAAALKKKMHALVSMKEKIESEGYAKSDTVEESIELFFEDSWLPPSKVILDFKHDVIIDERVLIHDASIYLLGQDHVVITGKNGSGKSCLMKQIAHCMKNRTDIICGYMPQNYFDLMSPEETPLQFMGDDFDYSRILLGALNFKGEEMEHPISKLSDGQKAKVYFAKLVKMKCNVLLLDEPTRNLSPMSQPVIHELLNSFEGCILCISHDRWLIETCFDQVLHVENQRLIKV